MPLVLWMAIQVGQSILVFKYDFEFEAMIYHCIRKIILSYTSKLL